MKYHIKMKIIYLWVKNEGWKAFDLDAAETKKALVDRHITIGKSVTIGESVTIGKHVTIGKSAEIGEFVRIGEYTTIGEYARIGDSACVGKSTRIVEYVTIGDSARIGDKEVIKKSLFITGSKHSVSWYSTGDIHIGCHKRKIDWWLENYKAVGKKEHYTKKQIEEYGEYIKFCDILQKSVKMEVKS